MPRVSSKQSAMSTCKHETLCFTSTSHAQKVGYIRPTLEQRLAAATPNGVLNPLSQSKSTSAAQTRQDEGADSNTYPAPLVLPYSEISLYPHGQGQSLRSWLRNNNVNRITPDRKTIYISLPPAYGDGVGFMKGWTVPKGYVDGESVGREKKGKGKGETSGMGLDYALVAKYVEVFYHGLEVKVLPEGWFSWMLDHDEVPLAKGKGKSKTKAKAGTKSRSKTKTKSLDFGLEGEDEEEPKLGLRSQDSAEYTVIHSRPTPNYPYSYQLNLNDILDFAIASPPEDAYALLMLLEHDLYEDEEDEFVCGRAYGGSRVAVVSGARYWPGFDEEENVERVHGWPASHCEAHLETFLGERGSGSKGKMKTTKSAVAESENRNADRDPTPLHRALQVYSPPSTPKALTLLHIARLARTASHELGHCFGIAHCMYYACIMQGSASLAEDARQPPYLCTVDEAKVLRATSRGVVSEKRMEAWRRERLVVMRGFCNGVVGGWEVDGRGSMFECLGEWIGGLLEEEEREEGKAERVVIDLTMDD